MSSTMTLAPGSLIAGKFRVIKPLGAGGMGAVYVVEHSLTKHQRALKLLHPEFAGVREVVERFLREASAAGHIGNQHIVETFDAGTLDDGSPYLVMELLKGESLGERLTRGPLDLHPLCELMTQACEGVQAAHDAGIVHRDLKPDNLFLEQRAGGTFVKLLDFGISKFDPSRSGELSVTREGAALGTPYYMSPEQMLGSRAIDHRTDVYALGVILYECLTGQKPFDAETLPLLAVRIHEGKCDPLSVLRPDVPEAFAYAVHRALRNHPDDRFQSARAMAEALIEALGEPAPKPPKPLEKTASMPRAAAEALQLAPTGTANVGSTALATSALGVSMSQARPAKASSTLALVVVATCGALAVGAVIMLRARSPGERSRDMAASAEVARPTSAAQPPTSQAKVTPESSTPPAGSGATIAPAHSPTARSTASARPASSAAKSLGKSEKSPRVEAQSLATDNPFK